MPPLAPPPRKMVTPPSIFANKNFKKQKKSKPKHRCCDDPKPEDDGSGQVTCANCFTQLAESNIVSEVQFSEDSRGAAQAQGGFVTDSSRHANTLGSGARRFGGNTHDASQAANATAKRILAGLQPRLRGVGPNIVSQAINLFQLASGQGFSTGRRTDEVVAACLYAICRRQNENEVLLIDISEIMRINVYRLGDIYKTLCRDCYLLDEHGNSTSEKAAWGQRPVEVESLIYKYCRKLEFGEKTKQVAEDASRILKRMKRDWIVTGRHPAGLCGACIIYAARMNNFRRSKREVVYVAKVADQTVSKRMEEFKRTRAAAMTVEQFRKDGLRVKPGHEPPAIAYANEKKRKFEEKKQERQASQNAPETIEIADGESDAGSRESFVATATPEPPEDEVRRKRLKTANGAPATPAATQQEPRFDVDGFAIPALPASMVQQDQPKKRGPGRPKGSRKKPEPPTEDDLLAEDEFGKELDAILAKDDEEDSLRVAQEQLEKDKAQERNEEMAKKQREAEARVQEQEAPQQPQQPARTVTFGDDVPPPQELVSREALEEEFADDPEVINCLLPERERQVKEQIWVAENMDWMRAQIGKEITARLNQEEKASKAGKKGQKGRKKKGKMGDGSTIAEATTPIETPLDANRAMFERRGISKGISRHINYEALRDVYGPQSSSSTSREPSVAASGEGSPEADGAAPAPAGGRPRTPPDTQPAQAVNGVTASPAPDQRDAQRPMSPPQTQAGAEQEDDDEEGDPDDYNQDELDYGSDAEEPSGWLNTEEDDREDIGDEGFGAFGRHSLPSYDDDEYGYGGGGGGYDGGTY